MNPLGTYGERTHDDFSATLNSRRRRVATANRTVLRHRQGPMLGIVITIVTGMAYSFLWGRLVHHSSIWVIPGDLWNTFRSSQYVVWGGEGQIYNNQAVFDSLPGIAMIIAPIAKLASVLHLSVSFPITLPRPSAWWILGPYELCLGALALLPLDALAQKIGVPPRRRTYLLAMETILIWPSVAIWGHPEDGLALALALFALLSVIDRAWLRVGFLFGLAVVIQPLILLVAPIVVALVPIKHWPILSLEMILPTAISLLPPLVQEWGPTTRILLHQPMYPEANHATPWLSLAPILKSARTSRVATLQRLKLPDGHYKAVEKIVNVHLPAVVEAGPGRSLAIVIAVGIGLVVKVRTPSWPTVVWLMSLALTLRCAFEPVMVPYYLLPGLALALLVAAQRRGLRFWLIVVAAAVATWMSYFHFSPVAYYVAIMAPSAIALLGSCPSPSTSAPSPGIGTFSSIIV